MQGNNMGGKDVTKSKGASASKNNAQLFHNPYHFVPVKEVDDNSNWAKLPTDEKKRHSQKTFAKAFVFDKKLPERCRHDRYLFKDKDGKDKDGGEIYNGRILCKLKTVTPIFVGGYKPKEGTEENPAEVTPFELDGKPAIPASTLRGMISSIAEAASNSSLRVLENRFLHYRKKPKKALSAIGLITKDGNDYKLFPLGAPTMITQTKMEPIKIHRGKCIPDYTQLNKNAAFSLPNAFKKAFKKAVPIKIYLNKKEVNNLIKEDLNDSEIEKFGWNKFYYIKLKSKTTQDTLIRGDRNFKIKTLVENQRKCRNGEGPIYSLLLYQKGYGKEIVSEKDFNDKIPNREKSKWIKGIIRRFPYGLNKHDYFLPFSGKMDKDCLIPIKKEAIEKFNLIAELRAEEDKQFPYVPKSYEKSNKLKEGDLVFFDVNSGGEVCELSYSAIWRDSAGHLFDYFGEIDKELFPFNPERNKISPAELVFGFVEDWKDRKKGDEEEALAYKGRVRFSHGISKEEVTQFDPVTLKILDSPKPPCPCLYFKNKNKKKHNHFIAKAALNRNDHEPQGRKFYLHHNLELEQDREVNGKRLAPWETHPELTKPNDNNSRLQQKTRIEPINTGNTFWFHIDFENLNEYELGMLLYALQPSENFHHRIGMGKPLGLGTVKIETVGLFLIDRKDRYASNPFNASERYHKKFVKNESELKNAPEPYDKMIYYSTLAKDFELSQLQTIKKSFGDKIEEDIKKAIELLGDPDQIKHPVHTPLCDWQKGKKAELETFKWFVANENKRCSEGKQQLKPISIDFTMMPTLERIEGSKCKDCQKK